MSLCILYVTHIEINTITSKLGKAERREIGGLELKTICFPINEGEGRENGCFAAPERH